MFRVHHYSKGHILHLCNMSPQPRIIPHIRQGLRCHHSPLLSLSRFHRRCPRNSLNKCSKIGIRIPSRLVIKAIITPARWNSHVRFLQGWKVAPTHRSQCCRRNSSSNCFLNQIDNLWAHTLLRHLVETFPKVRLMVVTQATLAHQRPNLHRCVPRTRRIRRHPRRLYRINAHTTARPTMFLPSLQTVNFIHDSNTLCNSSNQVLYHLLRWAIHIMLHRTLYHRTAT